LITFQISLFGAAWSSIIAVIEDVGDLFVGNEANIQNLRGDVSQNIYKGEQLDLFLRLSKHHAMKT
jgi:hypothetical protein